MTAGSRARASRSAASRRSPGDRSVEAETALTGQPVGAEAFRQAAEAALRDAKPRSENGFKVELAKRCLVHALGIATAPA